MRTEGALKKNGALSRSPVLSPHLQEGTTSGSQDHLGQDRLCRLRPQRGKKKNDFRALGLKIDQCCKFKHRRFLGNRLNQPLQVKTRYGVSRAADEEFSVKNGVSATFMCQRPAREMCGLANALLAHTAVGFLGISHEVLASPL